MTPKKKRETLKQRDTRHRALLYDAWSLTRGFTTEAGMLRTVQAAVYSVIPGKQRKRAYMDTVLETAVKAACRALRRRVGR